MQQKKEKDNGLPRRYKVRMIESDLVNTNILDKYEDFTFTETVLAFSRYQAAELVMRNYINVRPRSRPIIYEIT